MSSETDLQHEMARVQTFEAKLESLKRRHEELKIAYKVADEAYQSNFVERIEALQSELEECTAALAEERDRREEITRENERMTSEMEALKQRVKELSIKNEELERELQESRGKLQENYRIPVGHDPVKKHIDGLLAFFGERRTDLERKVATGVSGRRDQGVQVSEENDLHHHISENDTVDFVLHFDEEAAVDVGGGGVDIPDDGPDFDDNFDGGMEETIISPVDDDAEEVAGTSNNEAESVGTSRKRKREPEPTGDKEAAAATPTTTEPVKPKIPCPICGRLFTDIHNRNRHKRQIHDKSKNPTCSICGKKIDRTSLVAVHEATCRRKNWLLNKM